MFPPSLATSQVLNELSALFYLLSLYKQQNMVGVTHIHYLFAVYSCYRFLDEYKNNNISVWAMSTGNEPSNGLLPFKHFNSLGWTPLTISNWTVNYFGPQLRSSTHNKTLILAFDDQRLFLPWWIDLVTKQQLIYGLDIFL